MANYVDFSDINLSVDKSNSTCGDTLTYTLVVSNKGNTSANNVKLVNTLPEATTFVANSVYINGANKVGEDLSDSLIYIGTIPAGDTLTVSYKLKVKCDEEPEGPFFEIANIYKRTSLTRNSDNERKRFVQWIHGFEPLGVEVLQATDIEILVQGTNVSGNADIRLHDVNNVDKIGTVTSNQSKIINVPRKGQLFIDTGAIKNLTNNDSAFSFTVSMKFQNQNSYKVTPTFDMRSNKISNKVINSVNEFKVKAKESPNDGMLMISENVRLYMPLSQYVPSNFEPVTTLDMHEDIVKTYDAMVGLSTNNPDIINRPRRYFYLNTPRYQNVGYMSAGSDMIDAEPSDAFLFFEPNWGLFHEYGHLYDLSVGFSERSNNLFSVAMVQKYPQITWWGTDRVAYENAYAVPAYQDYVNGIPNDISDKIKRFRQGLYMLIVLTEQLNDFVKTFWTYHRNTTDARYLTYKEAEAHAYSIAINYGVNSIAYFELYGFQVKEKYVIDSVVDNSTSSSLFVPPNPNFNPFRNLSVTPITKGIYEGTNSVVTGVANPNATINAYINNNTYSAIANAQSKFTITIPESINLSTVVTITSTEPGKQASVNRVVKVRNTLADNKIEFLGVNNWFAASVMFDIYSNKLVVEAATYIPHSSFAGQVYYKLSLYDGNNNLKVSSDINGNEISTAFATELNNQSFADGDYIVLFHKESSTRLKIDELVVGAPRDLSTGFGTLDLSKIRLTISNGKLVYTSL